MHVERARPTTALRPILGRLGDLPPRLLLWSALCMPTLASARPLALADRAAAVALWSASSALIIAALPDRAFRAARWLTLAALPAILWWTGFAALNGVGPGWEAAVAVVSTSPREALEAASLAAEARGFVGTAIATFVLLLGSLAWRPPTPARGNARAANLRQIALAAALLPFAYSGVATLADSKLPALFLPSDADFSPLGSALRLAQEALSRSLDDGPSATPQRRPAPSAPRRVSDPMLAILVIGESLRADSLGPHQAGRGAASRQLSERIARGLGTWLPVTCAGANGTHASVPLLLTATPPARHRDARTAPSLLALLRAAGYSTAWLDNQDTVSFHEVGNDYEWKVGPIASLRGGFDEALLAPATAFVAPLLDAEQAPRARPRALVAQTMGSHFDYRLRYPEALFGAEPAGLKGSERVALQYARSVEYTALVLTRWANLLDRTRVPAFLVFTGDHGENLAIDGNGLVAHLGPRASLRDGTTTSLLLWNRALAEGGRAERLLRPLRAAPMISHVDVARAFLALAGLSDTAVEPEPDPKILAPVALGQLHSQLSRCTDLRP